MSIRVPLTNRVSGGSLGSGVSSNAGVNSLKATSDLFSAAGNVGQKAFDTQVKLERIEQSRKLNNLKSGIKNMTAEYQNELLKNKDSATWQPNYEERLSKFLGDNNAQDLSPEAREQWDMWHGDYIAGQKLRIARDATIQGLKNAELDLDTNRKKLEARGDFKGSSELMRDSGLYSKEASDADDFQTQKRRESWEDDQLRKWHNQQLDSDPQGYLDTLTTKNEKGEYIGYENLEIEERRMMIKNAEREVMSRRNDEGNLIKDRITTGEISSPQQLQEMRDNGKINYLTDADVTALKNHLTRDVPASDIEVVGAMEMIDQLRDKKGKISDTEYAKQFHKLENHVMGITKKGGNGWLTQRLNYSNPNYKPGSKDNLLKKGKVEAMEEATKHLGILYRNGDLGDYKNDDEQVNASTAKDYRSLLRGVKEWIQAEDKPVTMDRLHNYMGSEIDRQEGKAAGDKYKQSVKDNPHQKFRASGLGDTIKSLKGAHRKRADIPYDGRKAAIRYNNPSAAYPRKSDEKYGLQGYGVLKSGQGVHKIGRFPTPVHGAAANFHTFAEGYKGMTVYDAVKKWRGNGERGEKVVVPKGYNPNLIITDEFINDPEKATDFFSKMAAHESAGESNIKKVDWLKAWKMWKQNS